MQIHHSKHHNAYVTNLNIAMAKLDEATHKGDVAGVISAQATIKFNGQYSDLLKCIFYCFVFFFISKK